MSLSPRTLTPAISAVVIVAALFAPSCTEHCTDVACGPAPAPLEVIVKDTLSVDTTLYIARNNPTRIDTVDTVLVVSLRPTVDALVTLLRVEGTDTVAFDTLTAQNQSFYELDTLAFPATSFFVRAQRGNRSVRLSGLQLQRVEGCCSYPIVGRYSALLPDKP